MVWQIVPFEKKKMISVTGVTNKYAPQPALLEKHSRTLSWLSLTMHWKRELVFFQKILAEIKPTVETPEVRKEIEDLENRILFFTMEGIEELRRSLRNHESRLAKMLEAKTEWDVEYYKEHEALMESAAKLSENIEKLVDDLRSRKLLKEHAHN
jgi:hypothetical protein